MIEPINSILKEGKWNPQNRLRLEKLIREKAFLDNYAVFDWDFTCIFYDTQDNLLIYQLEHLYFKLTPEHFSKTIRADIPQDVPLKHCFNSAGRQLTAAELSADLDKRYEFIYHAFNGMNGTLTLDEIIATEEYKDFKAKMIALMNAAFSVCHTDICQLVSTGMTVEELHAITEKAIDESLTDTIQEYTITSSEYLPGDAGVVEASYRKGIRLQAEMQNLITVLTEYGITPYICSASQEDNVRVFASNIKYGYAVKPENVFGRRRLFGTDGKITYENDASIPPTRAAGKAEAIKKLMMPKHGGKPPILVAGDSDGDFFMMNEFKNDAVILLFNRNPKKEAKIYPFFVKGLEDRKNNTVSNILIQDRNSETGEFAAC